MRRPEAFTLYDLSENSKREFEEWVNNSTKGPANPIGDSVYSWEDISLNKTIVYIKSPVMRYGRYLRKRMPLELGKTYSIRDIVDGLHLDKRRAGLEPKLRWKGE